MFAQDKGFYEFGPYRLEPSERLLLRTGQPVYVPPKAFETLLLLVQNSGHVLTKEELMGAVWPDSFVEENNLTQHISQLRRMLGAGPEGQGYIETVPRLGYRFVVPVREVLGGGGQELVMQRHTRTHIVMHEHEEGMSSEGAAVESAEQPGAGIEVTAAVGARGSRAWTAVLLGVAAAGAVAAVTAALLLYTPVQSQEQAAALQSLRMFRLTTHGKAQTAAISPDGKYVAYVAGDPGDQSVWVRQVATHSDLQVLPPGPATLGGIIFSHDGTFLYYTARKSESEAPAVYRIPALGGEPRKIAENAGSVPTLSPDDRRLLFVRTFSDAFRAQLIVASAEGGEEHRLDAAPRGALGYATPAWSSDGKVIAAAVWSEKNGEKLLGVWIFDAESGGERELGRQSWTNLDSLAWLPDGKHLVMTASESSSGPAGQIWELSYPGGEYRRITNDLTDYGDVSVTADGKPLVTVGTEAPSNVWVAPEDRPESGMQITSGSVGFGGWSGLSWAGDDKLVYYSVAGGNQELWMMQADGTHPRRLTSSPGWKLQPSTCPDGRTVLFTVLSGARSNIWRVDEDGGNLKQLTFSDGDEDPRCSADSNWVIFKGGSGKLWKVSLHTEPRPEEFSIRAWNPAISPDGQWLACLYSPAPEKRAIAVLPIDGGPPVNIIPFARGILPVSSASKLEWTPDGKALAYVDIRKGVSNIWSQPLDGSAARQLTNFPNGHVFSFAWSRDGRRIAITRGAISSDVILISDFNR